MANEARVFAEGTENVIVRKFTVANANPLSKGQLLMYGTATRTGIAHTASQNTRPLGYTTSSKDASDGFTEIGCQRTGVVVAFADGVITTGDLVRASVTTANRVERANTSAAGLSYQEVEMIIGRALDSAVDAGSLRVALLLG